MASYCNDSADKVVSGELIASLECKSIGCFHNTQSATKLTIYIQTYKLQNIA